MSQRAGKTGKDSGTMPPAAKEQAAVKEAGPRATSLGNSATANLLGGTTGSKALPADVRARMEWSLGLDLGGVRVRDDSAARNAAESHSAEAFVEGGQIHWGRSAPPLESEEAAPLLAHEVMHVAQQREATTIEDRVSKPGEAAEMQASAGAARAMAGQQASAGAGGGAVAGTQRQPKPTTESDIGNAEEALTTFLKKVAGTQPPQDIRKAQVVKDALRKLAFSGGPSANLVDVEKFLASAPNDPAQMAHQFVSKLKRVSKAAVDSLASAPFIDQQPSKLERVKDLVTKSGAGGDDKPKEPGYVSPQDKAQEIQEKLDAMRGTKSPTTYGPYSVDILQLGRIFGNLNKTLNAPRTKPATPQAETYPAVEAVIAKIAKSSLVPAEAKGKGNEDEWANAQDFARDLANKLDVAQKSNQDTVTINLGDNYAHVKDREAVRNAVEAIIKQVRQALPHHASNVKYADVRTGKSLLTRGMAETP
jgi:hypothetical protein